MRKLKIIQNFPEYGNNSCLVEDEGRSYTLIPGSKGLHLWSCQDKNGPHKTQS